MSCSLCHREIKEPPDGADAGKVLQSEAGNDVHPENDEKQDNIQATSKIENYSFTIKNPKNLKKITNFVQSFMVGDSSSKKAVLTYVNSNETENSVSTPLLLACSHGNPETVEKLVKQGCSVNYVYGQADSPLRMAFHNGNIPVAKILLKLGADPMQSNIHGLPPIEAAINASNIENKTSLEAVKLLLENGVSANTIVQENFNQTALHSAVLGNKVPVVQLLLLQGADPNAQLIDGSTPLHTAVSVNKAEIIKLLLSNGADVYIEDSHGKTPLISAVIESSKLSVKALIKGGCDVNRSSNKDNTTPLNSAVNMLNLDMVKLLVCLGADPNKAVNDGVTPLHVLATINIQKHLVKKEGKICEDIAEYLIEKGGDINDARGPSPLELAVQIGNSCLSEIFLRLGANVNPPLSKFYPRPLFFYVIEKTPDIIINFLEYGWDYNAHDNKGFTPYHYAIKKKLNVYYIKSFIEQGCPYNQNHIIWHNLAKKSNLDVKRFFEAERIFFKGINENNMNLINSSLKKGALLTSCSEEIKYPLHFAAYKGYKDVLTFLLEKGVQPNSINEEGETPFYIAVKYGHYEICCILLRFGACYNFYNKCLVTPEMIAREKKHSTILDLVLSVSKMFHFACSRKGVVIKKLRNKLNNSITDYLMFANCINIKGDTLLGTAINNRCHTNVKEMIKLRLKINL